MAPSLAAELVEMIHENFQGFHPGYRGVHAQGRYYAAIFKATPEAKELSRAIHLQGQPVPVTVRHGHSPSGNPWGPAVTPSMAVKFYLPDGTVTDLIGLTIPLFFGRTPDEVLEGLKVLKPDPVTGKPDEKRVMQLLETRPWIANAFKLAKAVPAPVSLAQTAFHAIHAFRFVNSADEAVYARYHWEPEADVTMKESVIDGVNKIFEEKGRIDVVVNNAGYALMRALEETSMDEIKAQFETNFFGSTRIMQAVIPTIRKQGSGRTPEQRRGQFSRIINIHKTS
jgi:catalase